VANWVVVGLDRRMTLGVVADVNEQLIRLGREGEAVEQRAGTRLLLAHGNLLARDAIRNADGVGTPLGDSGEQRLSGESPFDAGPVANAVSGDATHDSRCSTSSNFDDLPTSVAMPEWVAA
jgi:hypothetical protein